MNIARKIFASTLVLATIISVSGFGFTKVNAAAPDMSLIKMNGLSTVYYLKGGKRYVFPNQKTFMSWYRDFSGVSTISQSELESYPLGGNVTYRAGVKLVKITTNPNVYAVGYNHTLHGIVSEANAISLWGANWAKSVEDVADSFFTNYTIGADLVAGKYGEGQLVKLATSADVVYFDGTNYRKFASEAAFNANRFSFAHVATAPASWTSFSPMGTDITGQESGLVDTAQGASGTVGGSGLSVALSADTPASANITKGATRVTFTKFNVTAANDGDVTLQTVIVTRGGVGAASDFENVYLYDGMTRLTTGRSVNSSTNKATFNNVNFTVAKGMTKTISVVADMSSSATTGNDNLSIALASDITANGATVSGSFPVTGNTMSITNVSGGTITIAKTGSITNPKAGELQAQVAAFTLQAGSAEDLKVQNVTLYQVGNISTGNLTNLTMKQAGNVVATATGMNSNGTIVFTFTTPYALDKGVTKTFEVYADVNSAARSGDTSRIYLDNSADLYATGNTYGYGATVTRTNYDNSAANGTDASWTSIDAGQVTLAFQGPSVTDYAVQQQDVELFRFTINAKSNIEVRSTGLTMTAVADAAGGLSGGGTTANYTDIKFVDVSNNQLVAGPKDVSGTGSDTSQLLTYTDTWTVNNNQTRTIKVTADIANFVPTATETIKATLSAFGASDIKNLDTNQYVATTDIVPNTAIVGNTHRVKAGTVTMSLAGTPSAQTYINGSSAIAMTGINVTAGTGKDIKITSLKLTAVGANDCATEANCVLNVKLWDGATQVGDTKSLSTDTVTFNNLNVAVAKGATKTLTATVDLNTLSTPITASTTLRLNQAAIGDVTAQDVDGNTVTVSGTVTGPNHTIVAAGTMTVVVAPDDSESEARIVLAGNTNEVLGKFKFTATREALRIAKIRVEIPAGAIEEVNSVSLWDGATRVTNDITLTSGTPNSVDFNSFVTDFIVPKDGNKTLTVKANLNSTSSGAASNTLITATLSNVAGTFEARGMSGSNTVLTESDVTLNKTGNNMYLRKTTMTVSQGTLTNALVNGVEQDMAKFTVTADAKGDVALKQMVFNVTIADNVGTNNTLVVGTYRLYRNNSDISTNVDIHNLAGATIESTNSLAEGTSQAIVTWSTEEVIAAGTTNTYTLRATPSGFANSADHDSVTTALRNDSTFQGATFIYINDVDTTNLERTVSLGILAGPFTTLDTEGATPTLATDPTNNVIWSDNSTVAHLSTLTENNGGVAAPTSSPDWFNTYLVKNFPLSGNTITQ